MLVKSKNFRTESKLLTLKNNQQRHGHRNGEKSEKFKSVTFFEHQMFGWELNRSIKRIFTSFYSRDISVFSGRNNTLKTTWT